MPPRSPSCVRRRSDPASQAGEGLPHSGFCQPFIRQIRISVFFPAATKKTRCISSGSFQRVGGASQRLPARGVRRIRKAAKLRPQARTAYNLFSAAACTRLKTLLALQVWNFCVASAEILRAAGRILVEKGAQPFFRQSQKKTRCISSGSFDTIFGVFRSSGEISRCHRRQRLRSRPPERR